MESATAAPTPTPPAVSVDGGAAVATGTATEANTDAIAEMAERLTIGTDIDANAGGPAVDLGAEGVYSCKDCRTHLARADDIISKAFCCNHGKAYLFDKIVNVNVGVQEDRMMLTGMHAISDVFCVGCGATLGWKYVTAHEKSQKYKEGKYILERYMLLGPDGSNYSAEHNGTDN